MAVSAVAPADGLSQRGRALAVQNHPPFPPPKIKIELQKQIGGFKLTHFVFTNRLLKGLLKLKLIPA